MGYGVLSLRCCLGELKDHMTRKLDCKPGSKPPSKMATAEQRHKLGLTSRTVIAALAMDLLFPQIFASLAPLVPQIWAEISHPFRGLPKPPDQQLPCLSIAQCPMDVFYVFRSINPHRKLSSLFSYYLVHWITPLHVTSAVAFHGHCWYLAQ